MFSKYTAENLVANRQNLSEAIRDGLFSELESYGINVISLSIENIDFTDAFTDAVEAKQVAAQKKLQAEIEQGQMTMETQQQAERKRINAEAEANVAKINAELWADLFLSNRTELIDELSELQQNIERLRMAVADGDREQLVALLNIAKTKKETFG